MKRYGFQLIYFLILIAFEENHAAPSDFELVIQKGHSRNIMQIVENPNNNIVVTAGGQSIKFWDSKSKKLIKTVLTEANRHLVMDPLGRYLVSCDMKEIWIWDMKTFERIRKFKASDAMLSALAIDPEGKVILSGCSSSHPDLAEPYEPIRIWDIQSGNLIRSMQNKFQSVRAIAVDPQSKYVVAGINGSIHVWELQSGQMVYTINAHQGGNNEGISCILIDPSGKYIISSGLKNVYYSQPYLKMWNLKDGSLIKEFNEEYSVSSLSMDGTGKYLYGIYNYNHLKVWDLEKRETIYSAPKTIQSLCVGLKNQVLYAGGKDGTLSFYNLPELELTARLGAKAVRSYHLSIDSMGKLLLAAGNDSTLKYWDLKSYKFLGSSPKHHGYIGASDMDPQGRFAVSTCGKVMLWDVQSNSLLATAQHDDYFNENAAADPMGRYAIAGTYGQFMLWDWNTGQPLKIIDTKKYNGSSFDLFRIDPSGRYAIIEEGTGLRIYDLKSGKMIKFYEIDNDDRTRDIRAIAIGPKGRRVLFSVTSWTTGNTIRVWQSDHTQGISKSIKIVPEKTLKGHYGIIDALAIDPTGSVAASGDDEGMIFLWDLESGSEIKRWKAHAGEVTDLLFSPDEKTIISASYDASIKVWNRETSKSVTLLNGESDWIIFNDEGYFDASRNGGELVGITIGQKAFGIDQFAIKNNRPDIVLNEAGNDNQDLKDHLYAQYQRRLNRFDIKNEQLRGDLYVPKSDILETRQDGKFVSVRFSLNDDKYPLKHYNIYVNDVPLFGGYGKEISGNSIRKTETVELNTGTNKIEVTCFNAAGAESFRSITYAEYKVEVIPDLYYLGFGVSRYQNSDLNLSYAHKDALDLAITFQGFSDKFGNVYVKTFTDGEVTVQNIKNAKTFLNNAKVDDIFVLFIAGHGMYSEGEDATYYYLTHNTDLSDLSQTAANFDLIEDLLQGIKPRKKLFLMDTCESGEIDEETQNTYYTIADSRGIKARTSRAVVLKERKEQPKRSYLYQKDRYIYNDLIRRSGAIVFSSSRGGEFSYESDTVQNGFFTEEILKCLTEGTGDTNGDGTVTTDELRTYVSKSVAEATEDAQHPTVDRDNIYQKFGFPVK